MLASRASRTVSRANIARASITQSLKVATKLASSHATQSIAQSTTQQLRQFSTRHLPVNQPNRRLSDKVYSSAQEALKAGGLKDGDYLLVGGFGLCGVPMACILAVQEMGVKSQ